MSEMIAVLIFVFATVTVIGLFLVSIPVTRRLGGVLEEWLKMRQEGAPDRAALDSMTEELRSLGRHVEVLDDRMQIFADRLEFTESLVESRGTESRALPPTS